MKGQRWEQNERPEKAMGQSHGPEADVTLGRGWTGGSTRSRRRPQCCVSGGGASSPGGTRRRPGRGKPREDAGLREARWGRAGGPRRGVGAPSPRPFLPRKGQSRRTALPASLWPALTAHRVHTVRPEAPSAAPAPPAQGPHARDSAGSRAAARSAPGDAIGPRGRRPGPSAAAWPSPAAPRSTGPARPPRRTPSGSSGWRGTWNGRRGT